MVERIRRTRVGGGLGAAFRQREGETPDAGHRVVSMDGDWAGDGSPAVDLLRSAGPSQRAFRHGDHVHVSDAIGKCLRKIALVRRLTARHPADSVPDGQGLTFAQGEAIHDFVKRRFVTAHPDKVWAKWTCKCRYTTIGPCTYARRGKQTTCPRCETEVDQFNEVPLYDEEHDLVGNPDLPLWLPQYRAFFPVEIKSMAGAAWKELARAVPDHIIQVAFYWHLMRVNDMPLMDRSSVLYASKEFTFKSPYKEFTQLQPDTQERLVPYFEDLKALKRAKEDPKAPLPLRTMCGTLDAPEAKKCHVCVACFSEGRK